jgi:hypothetical protein
MDKKLEQRSWLSKEIRNPGSFNTTCNAILKHYHFLSTQTWPPLWSNGQSSRLQIQRSRFHSRRYQIPWEVVGLQRGPPSLMSTTEELLRKKKNYLKAPCERSFLHNICATATKLPDRWPRDRGTIHTHSESFLCFMQYLVWLWGPPKILSNRDRELFSRWKFDWGMKVVLRLGRVSVLQGYVDTSIP